MDQAVHEAEARPLTREQARTQVRAAALHDSAIGPVGLELEFHLYDAVVPERPLDWSDVQTVLAGLPGLPGGSAVSVEPGGQLELSTPAMAGVVAAAAALAADQRVLSATARECGYAVLSIGADPLRTPVRVNPAPRYVAMERYFETTGWAGTGRAMMNATAAVQLNLNAGPAAGWPARLAHLHRLAPVLLAVSACSPVLGGTASGWRSMRQQCWLGMDPARGGALAAGGDPAGAWVDYALAAPVMLVREPAGSGMRPAPPGVGMGVWIDRPALLGRPPTSEDLAYHLTTLFPPVRPRGYLELRFLDAVPARRWPGLVAVAATLTDDAAAAELAAAACASGEPVELTAAARDGIADPRLRALAGRLLRIAVEHCPAGLRPDAEAYADLVAGGHTPGDEIRAGRSPLAMLEDGFDDT